MKEPVYKKDVANLHKNITVTSATSVSVIVTILLILAGLGVWLFAGTMTDKASAVGIIMPAEGIKNVTLPHSGTVSKMFVSKEETVKKGQRLALVLVGNSYSVLVSTHDGKVFSMKRDNDSFDAFEPIVSLVSDSKDASSVVCVAFTDLDNAMNIGVGQEAQVWMKTNSKNTEGYVRGKVSKVSKFPEKKEDVARELALEGYSNDLVFKDESVFEVWIQLNAKEGKPDELDWTYDSSSHSSMTPGKMCNVVIVSDRYSVFSNLFYSVRNKSRKLGDWLK